MRCLGTWRNQHFLMECLVYSWSWSKEIPLQELARRQLGHVPWVKYLVKMTRSWDSLSQHPGNTTRNWPPSSQGLFHPYVCNDVKLLSLVLGIISQHHHWRNNVDQVQNDGKLPSSLEGQLCCDSESKVRWQQSSPMILNWITQTQGHKLCQNRSLFWHHL